MYILNILLGSSTFLIMKFFLKWEVHDHNVFVFRSFIGHACSSCICFVCRNGSADRFLTSDHMLCQFVSSGHHTTSSKLVTSLVIATLPDFYCCVFECGKTVLVYLSILFCLNEAYIFMLSFKPKSFLVDRWLSFTAALSASKRRKMLYQGTHWSFCHSYDTVNFNVMLVNCM